MQIYGLTGRECILFHRSSAGSRAKQIMVTMAGVGGAGERARVLITSIPCNLGSRYHHGNFKEHIVAS